MNRQVKKVGIIGGGQLARMSILAGYPLGFDFGVLDPSENAPARHLSQLFIKASFDDIEAQKRLANWADVITYDIEKIETSWLVEAEQQGLQIFPSPQILAIIQDKLVQKQFFYNRGIPVPEIYTDRSEITNFPAVAKARRGGYDGQGVWMVNSPEDLKTLPDIPIYFEEKVNIHKELGVMIARDYWGEIVIYPIVEMIFEHRRHILKFVKAPAQLDVNTLKQVREVAYEIARTLESPGIYGIELFLDTKGRILLNEVAPRPHNLGHYSIEACSTSQFENHIRAITGLPLGYPTLRTPAVMINLLCPQKREGLLSFEGLEEALRLPEVHVHLYSKWQAKPFRKVGHITILRDSIEEAWDVALKVDQMVRITVKNEQWQDV